MLESGEIRYTDISVALISSSAVDGIHFVCSIHDITQRKQAEDTLQANEERLRTIVENIPVMISFFDSSGRFEFVNQGWLDQVGWTLEDLSNAEDPLALFYPDPEYRQQILDYMLSAGDGWRTFNSQTKHRGERITSWFNVRLSDGRRIGIGQDITERKKAEDELRRSEARYRALFEQSTDGVFILDLEGKHLYVNQQATIMFGYSLEEMVGLLFRDLVHTRLLKLRLNPALNPA